jgi:hypothetical protein
MPLSLSRISRSSVGQSICSMRTRVCPSLGTESAGISGTLGAAAEAQQAAMGRFSAVVWAALRWLRGLVLGFDVAEYTP